MEITFFWMVCAVVTAIIASAKNRNVLGWFLVGLFIGIFGIVLVALLPGVPAEKEV